MFDPLDRADLADDIRVDQLGPLRGHLAATRRQLKLAESLAAMLADGLAA